MSKNKKVTGFKLESTANGALKVNDIADVIGYDLTLGELANGYVDNSLKNQGGVTAWGGKLEVRPKFQRAYVVDNDTKWKTDLVNSVLNGRPIGVIYFGKNDDGTYINIDGQQRLMTLLSFINDQDALICDVNGTQVEVMFSQLDSDWQDKIKNYCPTIKVCTGDEDVMLEWFQTINKPICVLTEQELRNAAYNGTFVEEIKRLFAKVNSSSNSINSTNARYLDDSNQTPYFYTKWFKNDKDRDIAPERQGVVDRVLDWVSYRDFKNQGLDIDSRIESYMYIHRKDTNANDAENYYKEVIDWVLDIFFHNNSFPTNPREWQNIQNQDWNVIYEEYKETTKSYTDAQKQHITDRCKFYIGLGAAFYNNSRGIYEWVIRGEKNEEIPEFLHIRSFKDDDIAKMYKLQGGIDPIDGKHYNLDEFHAHHIVSFKSGGISVIDNMVLLSKENHENLHANCTHTPEDVKNLRNALIKKNGYSII